MATFSCSQKRKIAARAEPLERRIERDHVGDPETLTEPARRALDQWNEIEDGKRILQRRLENGGDENAGPRAYLAFDSLAPTMDTPMWVDDLEELVTSVSDRLQTDRVTDPTLPFVEVHSAIADHVISSVSLPEGVPKETLYDGFSEWWQLRTNLCLSRALLVEYRLYQRQRTESYTEFLDYLRSDGLAQFFTVYPVAGRLLTSLVAGFRRSIEKFATHLIEDLAQVTEVLPGEKPVEVVSVSPGKGDPHGDGRTVVEVLFDEGRRAIYKPRSVGPERQFSETLRKLTARGAFEHPHDSIGVLDRGDHGWVEYVPGEDTMAEEASTYYQRTGNLLGLLFLLSTTDCHYENVIADGDQPVLVDCETVTTHTKPPGYASDRHGEIDILNHHIYSSTLGTLMLPFNAVLDRTDSPDKQMYGDDSPDVSAIGAVSPDESTHAAPHWCDINTPDMTVEYELGTTAPASSTPSDGDQQHWPSEYVDSIVAGFEAVYDHFNRSADGTVQSLWDSVQPRFMTRPTSLYVSLMYNITEPTALKNAAVVDAKLDTLGDGWIDHADHAVDDYWPVVAEERRALWRLDVPRFHITDRSLVSASGLQLESYFEQTCSDRVVSSTDELTTEDRQREADRIRAAIETKGKPELGDHSAR